MRKVAAQSGLPVGGQGAVDNWVCFTMDESFRVEVRRCGSFTIQRSSARAVCHSLSLWPDEHQMALLAPLTRAA